MSWLTTYLTSSIGKKVLLALPGLFLCLFLVGHLAGNLQLFMSGEEGRIQFNEYAKFMTSNPAVKLLSYVTYFSILFHAAWGIYIARKNSVATSINYKYNRPGKNSTWQSRNMALLGIITLVFIIIHLKSFWYEMHWGAIGNDSNGNKDLHTMVIAAFKQWWYVLIYVVSMIALAYHLVHGFQSAFQTLGITHPKYTPIIKGLGMMYSILVPLLFAIIPVYIYFFI